MVSSGVYMNGLETPNTINLNHTFYFKVQLYTIISHNIIVWPTFLFDIRLWEAKEIGSMLPIL